jgi:hypothetical protein
MWGRPYEWTGMLSMTSGHISIARPATRLPCARCHLQRGPLGCALLLRHALGTGAAVMAAAEQLEAATGSVGVNIEGDAAADLALGYWWLAQGDGGVASAHFSAAADAAAATAGSAGASAPGTLLTPAVARELQADARLGEAQVSRQPC